MIHFFLSVDSSLVLTDPLLPVHPPHPAPRHLPFHRPLLLQLAPRPPQLQLAVAVAVELLHRSPLAVVAAERRLPVAVLAREAVLEAAS